MIIKMVHLTKDWIPIDNVVCRLH